MKRKILLFAIIAALLCLLEVPIYAAEFNSADAQQTTLSVGQFQVMFIKTDGSLWGWGNYGLGKSGPRYHQTEYGTVDSPELSIVRILDEEVPVNILDDVVSVDVDGPSAIKSDGSLWMWGYYIGGSDTYQLTPSKVMDDVRAASGNMFIKTDNTLWEWRRSGDNRTAQKIMEDVAEISTRGENAAIKTDGSLWIWTGNKAPVKVMEDVASIGGAGNWAYAVIKRDGSLWTWGKNEFGQLGDGTTTARKTPKKIMDNMVSVRVCGYSMTAIDKDRNLWIWGGNRVSQPEDGDTSPILTPQKVLSNVVAAGNAQSWSTTIEDIDYTWYTSVALRADGTLWTWGYGDKHHCPGLGDGTTESRTTPTQILSGVRVNSNPWITFRTNSETGDLSVAADSSGNVTPLQIPTKAGHSFVAWYKDAALTEPWNFSDARATDDMTLYGKWAPLATGTATAVPNQSTVLVDGSPISFEAYTINGNNYFKLRDLAYVLNGGSKCFSVGWDDFHKAITLKTGATYSSVGGELALSRAAMQTVSAAPATIYLNGQEIFLSTYIINDNHFFKLRDLGVALNFGVEWDSSARTVSIQSDRSYSADQ